MFLYIILCCCDLYCFIFSLSIHHCVLLSNINALISTTSYNLSTSLCARHFTLHVLFIYHCALLYYLKYMSIIYALLCPVWYALLLVFCFVIIYSVDLHPCCAVLLR